MTFSQIVISVEGKIGRVGSILLLFQFSVKDVVAVVNQAPDCPMDWQTRDLHPTTIRNLYWLFIQIVDKRAMDLVDSGDPRDCAMLQAAAIKLLIGQSIAEGLVSQQQ